MGWKGKGEWDGRVQGGVNGKGRERRERDSRTLRPALQHLVA